MQGACEKKPPSFVSHQEKNVATFLFVEKKLVNIFVSGVRVQIVAVSYYGCAMRHAKIREVKLGLAHPAVVGLRGGAPFRSSCTTPRTGVVALRPPRDPACGSQKSLLQRATRGCQRLSREGGGGNGDNRHRGHTPKIQIHHPPT